MIAAAHTREAVVVTDERLAGLTADERNLRIPNIAAEFGVGCIGPVELVRREGWRF